MSGGICLRDLLRESPQLGHQCFYCGLPATEVDHSRPRRRRGSHHGNNLKPACRRCNTRKRDKTRAEFRAYLSKLERAAGRSPKAPLQFYGEGARGQSLRRLRRLLARGLRTPPDAATRAKSKKRKLERAQIRWLGRFTFTGDRALRALAAATGCTHPVIERFVLGADIASRNMRDLTAACRKLKLDGATLRALKPPK